MLSENLKNLRKRKGLSQEELAIKLNVVRQTISKWEKGLSVPDSEMLLKIAEELETSVSVLLGETINEEVKLELQVIAEKLEVLNEQFAKRNERNRKIWRIIFIITGVIAFLSLLQALVVFVHLQTLSQSIDKNLAIIGGSDGPTSIFVSRTSIKYNTVVGAALAAVSAIIGIFKTKRKQ